MGSIIDEKGLRQGIGIILCNQKRQLLLAKRANQQAWQFPQGGAHEDETLEQTLWRELWEEVGLKKNDVSIKAETKDWLIYYLPKRLIRYNNLPLCVGQKQKWYLLEMQTNDAQIQLDTSKSPEFEQWRWVDYWYPIRRVIAFKKKIYREALMEFAPTVFTSYRAKRKGR